MPVGQPVAPAKSPAFDPSRNRIFRKILSAVFCVLGHICFRLHYEGLENVPAEGAFMLVANHTSMVDIVVIHTRLRRWLYWVAKQELFHQPFFRWIMPGTGAIPVDRDKVDLQAAKGIFAVLQAGCPIAMFPQGTRVPEDEIDLLPPRNGSAHFAIKTGVPILPVAVDGVFKPFHRVRIIYGKPFTLDTDPKKRYTSEEYQNYSIEIMRRVYALINRPYREKKP